MKIEYITSNSKKFEEAQHIMSSWDLERIDLDLVEIQGEPEEVISAKAKNAFSILKRPLIVEDVSLCCPAIGGMPGPYIKDFLKKIGERGIYELIHKYDDHSVKVMCLVAYVDSIDQEPLIFEGSQMGTIVAPRGLTKHGLHSWNSIVQPLGMNKTYGELSIEEHSKVSMRFLALSKLDRFLKQKSSPKKFGMQE